MVGDVACGVVEIENDFFVDGNKQFVMMLEENSAYMLEAPLNTSVTIEDDESKFSHSVTLMCNYYWFNFCL